MNEKDVSDIRRVWQKWCASIGRYPRLAAVGGLGLALMLGAPMLDADETEKPTADAPPAMGGTPTEEAMWEEKLKRILSAIDGAGEVEVAIQIEEEKRIEHEKNRTQESRSVTDGSGGYVTVEEKVTEELPMRRENGAEIPVIARTLRPAIKGVLVVAEGGASSVVRANIREAVETATGVPAYRVKVLAKKREVEYK